MTGEINMALSQLMQEKKTDKTKRLELGVEQGRGTEFNTQQASPPKEMPFHNKTFKFGHGGTCLQSCLLRRLTQED